MPSVSNYPEPVVISRPPPIAEESYEDMEIGSPGGAGIPSLPATHYRFKLPPLQVANATLLSTNRMPDSAAVVGSPPPKTMTSVGEPVRNKAGELIILF